MQECAGNLSIDIGFGANNGHCVGYPAGTYTQDYQGFTFNLGGRFREPVYEMQSTPMPTPAPTSVPVPTPAPTSGPVPHPSPPSVPTSCEVFITSYRGENLEDRNGTLGLSNDTGAFQKWRITDARRRKFFITSHRGVQLEDREGTLGLHEHTGGWQKWEITDARRRKFFITSHRGEQLEDRNGIVGLRDHTGGFQKWSITPVHPAACQQVDPSPDKYKLIGHACRTASMEEGTYDLIEDSTLDSCEDACDESDSCVAFEFKYFNNRCEIHKETITQSIDWPEPMVCYVKNYYK